MNKYGHAIGNSLTILAKLDEFDENSFQSCVSLPESNSTTIVCEKDNFSLIY